MSNVQERRECDNLVDTDTDIKPSHIHDTEDVEKTTDKNLTTVIAEIKKDKKY